MARASGVLSTKLVRATVVGAASAVVGVVLLLTAALQGPERTTWDWRVRTLAAPTEATDDVILVLVDQESLELMSSQNGVDWPWPRSFYGFMLEFFRHADAASVTFDIILEDEGQYGVDDDRQMLAAAAEYGRTIYGAELLARRGENVEPWPSYVGRPDLTVENVPQAMRRRFTFAQASFPHQDVIPANATLAFVNQENDDDGVFRRYRLLSYHDDQPIPALASAPLIVTGDEPLVYRFDGGALYVGEARVPLDTDGNVLLRYTTPGETDPDTGARTGYLHENYPAFDVVISGFNLATGDEPTVEAELFTGKHVFVGLSASGLLDLRPTPLDPRAPGVSVHATMLDNLLAGDFLQDLPTGASIALIVVLTLGAAFAATYAQRTVTEALLSVGVLALIVGLAVGGYLVGYWVPLVVPLVTVFLALAAANVANYATEGAQKRFIRGAFGQYLSPDVISELESDPDKLRLGGEKRELTMFFSDIQGFTTLSEGLQPEQLSGFLNHYLTELVSIIQDEGGTIDKFEGDAIIAFWNAPLDLHDHPLRAVRAALACQQRLAELRPEYAKPITEASVNGEIPGVGREIYTRIGLNTAEVSVGNFGSRTRFDYTALGDGMNLASRLEGANKVFGTYAMISHATRERIGETYPVRELGRIAVVGRLEPVTVYEPFSASDYEQRRRVLETYDRALRLWYNNRLEEAREVFGSIAGEDIVAAKMVDQCDIWLATDPDERASWTGVTSLTEK
ncbi:MAG: CHASE2 domain-containing protein [Spirochaetota bacterium]